MFQDILRICLRKWKCTTCVSIGCRLHSANRRTTLFCTLGKGAWMSIKETGILLTQNENQIAISFIFSSSPLSLSKLNVQFQTGESQQLLKNHSLDSMVAAWSMAAGHDKNLTGMFLTPNHGCCHVEHALDQASGLEDKVYPSPYLPWCHPSNAYLQHFSGMVL